MTERLAHARRVLDQAEAHGWVIRSGERVGVLRAEFPDTGARVFASSLVELARTLEARHEVTA
jgi:hypothetical protein